MTKSLLKPFDLTTKTIASWLAMAFADISAKDPHLSSIVSVAKMYYARELTGALCDFTAQVARDAALLNYACSAEQSEAVKSSMIIIQKTIREQSDEELFSHAIPTIKSAAHSVITTLGQQNSAYQDIVIAAENVLHFDNPNLLGWLSQYHDELAATATSTAMRNGTLTHEEQCKYADIISTLTHHNDNAAPDVATPSRPSLAKSVSTNPH